MRRRISLQKILKKIGVYGINLFWAFILLSPILWIFITSLAPEKDLTSKTFKIVFSHFSFNNYMILREADFLHCLTNTIFISTSTAILSVCIGFLGAYGVTLFKRGKGFFLLLILMVQMLPAMAMLIPLYLLMTSYHLIDTYFSLILVYTSFLSPLAVWLLIPFYNQVPASLGDAARIDGCSYLGVLWRIILPLSFQAIGAVGIFCFIGAWHDLLFALVLTTLNAKTLMVKVSEFRSVWRIDYGLIAASAIIASVPLICLALIFQKLIIKGLTEGAVKG